MKLSKLVLTGILLLAAFSFSACGQPSSGTEKIEPVSLEPIGDGAFSRVTLTEKAAQRLDIQTDAVREETVEGAQTLVVPYAAVIYGLNGETWVYTTDSQPLTYVRAPITVNHIDGDMVILSDGPDAGTEIVVVGVAELFGAETGVSK